MHRAQDKGEEWFVEKAGDYSSRRRVSRQQVDPGRYTVCWWRIGHDGGERRMEELSSAYGRDLQRILDDWSTDGVERVEGECSACACDAFGDVNQRASLALLAR